MDNDEFMSKTNQEDYVPEPLADIESVEPSIAVDEKRAATHKADKVA